MPKVYTYNAEFNPISFADRIAPMRLYKEEYDKQQAAYEKLLEETDDLEALKNIAMDSDSYNTYNGFRKELESIADEMSTKGLSQDLRNRLLNLKRRQTSEINPLLDAQKKRAELVAEQRKYLETHPNSIFDIDYNQTPISKVKSESTFRPYDLGSDYAKVAEMVYSNMMSNNGVDNTDYSKIKSQYDYDNLSPLKQKAVDDMINLAKGKASATYQIYKDKEAMDRYRYGRTGTRTSGSTKTTPQTMTYSQMLDIKNKDKYIANVNGNAAQITTSANGVKSVKNYKGIDTPIDVPQRNQGETDDAYEERLQKAVAKAYYGGYNLKGSIRTNAGENITILEDDRGNHYIVDSKKNVKPVSNINSFRELATVYRDKPVNYEDGVNAMISNNGELYEKKDTDVLDTSNPAKVYRTLADVDDDLTNFLMMQDIEDSTELFNDGFSIYKYKITNKRGTVVGHQYVIKSNNNQPSNNQATASVQTTGEINDIAGIDG